MESNLHDGRKSKMYQLGERPHSAMRQASSHQRTMTEHLRRPSPMQARGRSNTLTSDYIPPDTSPPFSFHETAGMPYDRRSTAMSVHSRNERSGSFSKSLKTKASRLLRRQESNTNLTSLRVVDWSEELDESPYEPPSGPSLSPQRNTRHTRQGSPLQGKMPWPSPLHVALTHFHSAGPALRFNISEPFNFQHLTHTEHKEYKRMQDAPGNDFVSEFSAMRASQAPRRELRGIKAETIARQDPPFRVSPPILQSPYASPPRTPRQPSDGSSIQSLPSPTPTTSQQTSSPVDETAQTILQVGDAKEAQDQLLPSPLPRYNPPDSLTYHSDHGDSPVEPNFEASVAGEDTTPYDIPIATFNDSAYDFATPHAVTTPDDAAHVLRPPPFGMIKTELSRVIEEDEHSEGRRSSTATPTRRPSTANSSLRHVKSFPSAGQPIEQIRDSIAESYRVSIQTSPKKQRMPIKVIQPSFDDATAGDVPFQARQSRRFSATVKDTEGNWEDLVDWCYDHEAEADCNFDFARAVSPTSDYGVEETLTITTDLSHAHPLDRGLYSDAFATEGMKKRSSSIYSTAPRVLLPLQTSLPELEPPSAISTQSSFDSVSEAVTPNLSTTNIVPHFPTSHQVSKFSKSIGHHSPHVSNDMTSTDIYEALCQETYARESWHYGRPEGSTISSASPRSSRSPISKSSSQESFWNRRLRNTNSQGSLPDLVAHRFSREKADQTADQLADHMAALGTEDLSTRRRSPSSLVKDVAQKNLLSRIQNGVIDDATNAEVPLPLHPALRETTGSGAASKDAEPFTLPQPAFARPAAARMRSASSAASLKPVNISPRASRASYGLYPINGRR